MERPRILLIYTGGTIGMIKNRQTGTLQPIDFENLRQHVPELKELDYEIRAHQFQPPIDSSDMRPALWAQLVHIIAQRYDDFDGFVILHGTDTMAYTASALSFMLEGLRKPVILTGSQLPIGVLRTDGKENLIGAIELAAATDSQGRPMVPEVTVYFGSLLLRGNRSTKASAERFEAFASYNFPPLATVGININYNQSAILHSDPFRPLIPHVEMDNSVIAITLFPGIRPQIIEHVFEMPDIRGIILRTYGSGNAPQQPWLLNALRNATDDGKVVVNITQCDAGAVEMGLYETGNQLLRAGVVSGGDMTVECAVTKLMYLLAQGLPPDEVRRLMAHSLAGEVTEQ
ncbi:MAG: type I asparaginase [Bacteroidaceae bacterium]|nr:type I asparaginase [Bacteroidaceae bacterium]